MLSPWIFPLSPLLSLSDPPELSQYLVSEAAVANGADELLGIHAVREPQFDLASLVKCP